MSDMDKIFRNKLYDHGSEVPQDLWGRIEAELEPKRKSRLGFWYWGLGMCVGLAIGGSVAFSYWSNTADRKETVTDTQVVAYTKPSIPSQDGIMVNALEVKTEVASKDKAPQKNAISVAAAERKKEISSLGNRDKTVETPIALEKTSSAEEITQNLKSEALPSEASQNLSEIARLKLPQGNIDLKDRKLPDPIGCPTFTSRDRANFFVESYYKPFYAYNLLGANGAEVGDGYVNLRKNTEGIRYSWSAGLNVGWISDYNVGIKAGVEYEVINEKFSYIDPEAIRNQTIITIDTIFGPGGSVTITSDTSVVQVIGTEMQEIANQHRTLSIPIHALYYIDAGDLDFEISGGPIFNLTYTNRGKIVDPANEDRWFSKGESGAYDVFRDRLRVSFSLSASILYSLNENIQLYARPEFKFHPSSIGKVSAPFSQRYLNTGLAVGARYYFSGNPNF